MTPPASEALLHKLRHIERDGLLSPDAAGPLPSPCVSICRMDDTQTYCTGCLRTLDELRIWGTGSVEDRRRIWLRIRERCAS